MQSLYKHKQKSEDDRRDISQQNKSEVDNDFIYLDNVQLALYNGINDFENVTVGNNNEKKKYRNVYCVNCGEKGHVVKDCDGPITSFGILAFKVVKSHIDEFSDKNHKLINILKMAKNSNYSNHNNNNYNAMEYVRSSFPKIKFLMIQRKDTMGYIDFIRGKYPENDEATKKKLLQVCLDEMIFDEKRSLLTKSFDQLWNELWLNKNSKTYRNEYSAAKSKYMKLDIQDLVSKSPTQFNFQEFGFPKGRRNMKETNIACAEREFFEETGYTKLHYDFIKHYPTIHEEFVGTNGIRYRHIYYLVKMRDNAPPPRIDSSNILQAGEVQNIGWFTFEECMSLIRPYDEAKKNVIETVYNDIINMKHSFVCSNFYYNTKKIFTPILNSKSHIPDYRSRYSNNSIKSKSV